MAKTIKTVTVKQEKKLTVKAGKSRDLVHLQEITHGTGCGAHKNKKDKLAKIERKKKENRYSDEYGSSYWQTTSQVK